MPALTCLVGTSARIKSCVRGHALQVVDDPCDLERYLLLQVCTRRQREALGLRWSARPPAAQLARLQLTGAHHANPIFASYSVRKHADGT
jgi:hypothetical protein